MIITLRWGTISICASFVYNFVYTLIQMRFCLTKKFLWNCPRKVTWIYIYKKMWFVVIHAFWIKSKPLLDINIVQNVKSYLFMYEYQRKKKTSASTSAVIKEQFTNLLKNFFSFLFWRLRSGFPNYLVFARLFLQIVLPNYLHHCSRRTHKNAEKFHKLN